MRAGRALAGTPTRRARRHRKLWHLVAKVAGAFRAARGGAAAWGYAIANWVLKLGIVGLLLVPPRGAARRRRVPAPGSSAARPFAGVLTLLAVRRRGVGTYEAGVALGAQVRHDAGAADSARLTSTDTSAETSTRTNTDNQRLVFGAALAVHALMVAVALVTALVFSLIMRLLKTPESSTT